MKKLVFVVSLLFFVGCSKEPVIEKTHDSERDISGATTQQAAYTEEQAKNSVKNSMGYKLISIADHSNDVSTDDPRVSALNGKLEYLSNQTGMSEADIADMSYFLEKELKKHKRKSDIDEVLEVVFLGVENHACNLKSSTTRDCIANLLGTYATTRINTNQDHQTAIHSLKSILNVVNNPEKREKLEETINSNKN